MAKFIITIPQNKGDPEYANFLYMWGEINRDNHYEYTIEEIKEE